ncbi:MAG: GAF domain-containing protein, partial [Solirubrobacteraceae bacterium]
MLEQMLRLGPGEASDLAEEIGSRTHGNPHDAVELVNALRRDRVLVPDSGGWRWDSRTIRSYIGRGDASDFLVARFGYLPDDCRSLLRVLALLGGELPLDVLALAADLPMAAVESRLAPAVDDGLLAITAVAGLTARFGHDRARRAACAGLDPQSLAAIHLTLGRRFALHDEHAVRAATQYLTALDSVTEHDERRLVAELFRTAAASLQSSDYAQCERLLEAAVLLVKGTPAQAHDPLVTRLMCERHAALFNLGRLDEADDLYAAIARRRPDPLEMTPPACIQISGLTNRDHPHEAIVLGLELLRALGLVVPADKDVAAETERGLDEFRQWLITSTEVDDLDRPEVSDPTVIAAASLINRLIPAAFFSGASILGWLVVQARRLWARHGPCAPLVAPVCHASHLAIPLRDDYLTGYLVNRRVLAVSEKRGYEPETSQARFLFSVGCGHWFETLENVLVEANRAHEGLLRWGDPQYACFTYHASYSSIDCASSLGDYVADIETGLDYSDRMGNEQTSASSVAFRQLARSLQGQTLVPGEFDDDDFDEALYLEGIAQNPMAAAHFHIAKGLAALLLGNADALLEHAMAAAPLLLYIDSHYLAHTVYLLRGMAFGEQAKNLDPPEQAAAIAALDEAAGWLARRAEDGPTNFSHLRHLLEAERAWAVGDGQIATATFDQALAELDLRHRPWHRAFIAERAGLCHIAQGLTHTGRALLSEARDLYEDWGASAKVEHLEQQHPHIIKSDRSRTQGQHSTKISVASEAIDLMAVLQASQALSSETNLERLEARVVEIVGSMAGATTVRLLLFDSQTEQWFLPSSTGTGQVPIPIERAAELRLLPVSAIRYAERTREPLLVSDALSDHRFNQDPYVSAGDCRSLMVVPILAQGSSRAMLVLEDRHSEAFSGD